MGVYGSFDPGKFDREFRSWFTGVEATNLRSVGEARLLAEYCHDHGIGLGVHYPLVAGPAHPFLTSRNKDKRAEAYGLLRASLVEAKALGATYVLAHYPKPALLAPELDWRDWRFPYPGEAVTATEELLLEESEIGHEVFSQLEQLSHECGIQLVLEHDILHSLHYSGLLQSLFAAHSSIGLCVDTGRLHMLEHTDSGFDGVNFIRQMAPYITNLHLWTVRLGTNKEGGHHPLLPRLSPDEGWGRMAEYLTTLADVSVANVLFEHRADLISSKEMEEC